MVGAIEMTAWFLVWTVGMISDSLGVTPLMLKSNVCTNISIVLLACFMLSVFGNMVLVILVEGRHMLQQFLGSICKQQLSPLANRFRAA